MKQINLYQSAFRPPSIALPARKMAASAGVFALGLLALYAWDAWQLRLLQHQVAQISQRADAVTRQVRASAPAARQADAGVAVEAQSLEARVRALQLAQDAIASGTVGSETGFAAPFRGLGRAVGNTASPGAWLTGVTLFDNGRGMDLQGRALSGDAAARLIGNLRREPLFVGMSFAGLSVAPPADKEPANKGLANKDLANSAPAGDGPPPFLVFSLNARQAEAATPAAAPAREIRP